MSNSNNAANVVSGKPRVGGAVFVAPIGTPRPADATAQLNAAYKNLGYTSDDGVKETTSRSTEKIKAWGGDTVKVIQNEFGVEVSLTLIELLNAEVLKLVHGAGNVDITPATASKGNLYKLKLNSEPLPAMQFAIDLKDGDAVVRLDFIGQITETGDITYKDEEVVGYEITITALPDSEGNSMRKYINDGRKTG